MKEMKIGNQFAILLMLAGAAFAGQSWEVGLTRNAQLIDAFESAGGTADAPTVLLISSLDGDEESRINVISQASRYDGRRAKNKPLRLFAIVGLRLSKGNAAFPPSGHAYRENSEAHALWRWIGVHAPDLVLIEGEDFGLARALSENAVAGVGRVPAQRPAQRDHRERGNHRL